jgi:hypothetical protein
MLMGSSLESNWNTNAVGDNGESFGPFQIHITVHPGVSSSQAQDPVFAAKYMLPAYQAGVSKVSPSLWQSNPAQAAATAAYYAERPAKMYSGYEAKWSQVQAALNGADISGPVTGASGGVGGGADSGGVLSPVEDAVNTWGENLRRGFIILANMSLFFSAALLGSIMFLVGLILIFRQTGAGGTTSQIKSAARVLVPGAVVKAVSRG